MIYKPSSIVLVPFPFTDKNQTKKRPALVLSSEKFQKENGHVSLLMITTAKKSSWYGDYHIKDLDPTNLPVSSYVRQKIFTIDSRLVIKTLGDLSPEDRKDIRLVLDKCLSI